MLGAKLRRLFKRRVRPPAVPVYIPNDIWAEPDGSTKLRTYVLSIQRGDTDVEAFLDENRAYLERQRRHAIAMQMHERFRGLSPRERDILRERFFTEPPGTLDTISKTLRITRERVRQELERALLWLAGENREP